MNPLFSPIQFNKVDSICENLHKDIQIKNLSISSVKPDILYGEITFLNVVMNNIDDSVVKVFKQEELPDKEVVRRVLRLWN